jgi:transcriptional regulator with XRE-family HTH domain
MNMKAIPEDEAARTERELQNIGKRIREMRIAKGYSSHETFAYDHEFSRSQINGYERGKDIRLSTLLRILHALDINPREFFDSDF